MSVLLIVLFFSLVLISFPISSVLAFLSTLPGILSASFPGKTSFLIRGMIGGSDSFLLLAIPMFILSGVVMTRGKISNKIFEIFAYFFGRFRIGLPAAAIVTCLFYGAISGSAPATTAAVGTMLIPVLSDLGYDEAFISAIIATAGGLGVIIPPSIPLILYGNATGTSVSDLFFAGILPGIMIASVFILVTWFLLKKHKGDTERRKQYTERIRNKGLKYLLFHGMWAILAPVIVLGAIYSGLASPTESAVISVFYALFISMFIYKTIGWKDLKDIFLDSVKIYAPLLFLLAAALVFSRILAILQIPTLIGDFVHENLHGKLQIIFVIQFFLLLVGMVMDTGASILILSPILLPIVQEIGMNPVHFGIIMVVNLAIGFITPPVGVNLFVVSGISNVPIHEIAKKSLPYIVGFLIALTMIILYPALTLI